MNGRDGLFVTFHKTKIARQQEIITEKIRNKKAIAGQSLYCSGIDKN